MRGSTRFLFLAALLCPLLLACGGDDDDPTGPGGSSTATVAMNIPTGGRILSGFARAHHEPDGQGDRFGDWPPDETTVRLVLEVPPGESAWTFDLQGRLLAGADTTGNGLLFTAGRTIQGSAGDPADISVRLVRVVPDPVLTSVPGLSHRISWPQIDRAASYELLEARGLLPDLATELAGTDTVLLAKELPGPGEYRVRARLRDGRASAPSEPIPIQP